MSSLRELQVGFMQALFARHETSFAEQLLDGERSGERRLDIYRNNTYANLRNAMRSAYPVVVRLVGDAFFDYATSEYISRYPSRSGDLHEFGGEFAAFLVNFPPAATLPYLPDVARLEWACHSAFFAADHPPLDLLRLARVPAELYGDLTLQLHPACRLLTSAWPVDRIWRVNQEDYHGDQAVDLATGGVRLLIRRPRHHAEVVALSEEEWCFLDALASGEPLGLACDMALQCSATFDPGMALLQFVAEDTLVDFRWPLRAGDLP